MDKSIRIDTYWYYKLTIDSLTCNFVYTQNYAQFYFEVYEIFYRHIFTRKNIDNDHHVTF